MQVFVKYLFFICLISKIAYTEDYFNAYVDSTVIEEGESFFLTLEYPRHTDASPNLTELKEKFAIYSQSTSNDIKIINGHKEVKTTWRLKLMPKYSSKIIKIPSITWDKLVSKEISIKVTNQPIDKSSEIEFDAVLSKNEAYVNEQVILTVTLKTTKNFAQASIEEPKIAHAIVEQLGKPKEEYKIINGVKTLFFEKKYAIFFDEQGEKSIPRINFEGQYIEKVESSFPFQGFFSDAKQKRVVAKSHDLKIKIKPVPENFPKGSSFLPLEGISFTDSFTQSEINLNVGQAINRNFSFIANGTIKAFLPTIKVFQVNGLNSYEEAADKSDELTENGLNATLKISHTYIPTTPGNFIIPKQIIYWWDLKDNQLKELEIPKVVINVSGTVLEQKNFSQDAEHIDEKKSSLSNNNKINIWKILSCILLVLLLLSFVAIGFLLRRKTMVVKVEEKIPHDDEIKKIIGRIKSEISKNDYKSAYKSLLSLRLLAKSEHRSDIILLFESGSFLSVFLLKLEEQIYKGKSLAKEEVKQFLEAFEQLLRKKEIKNLKELYPK